MGSWRCPEVFEVCIAPSDAGVVREWVTNRWELFVLDACCPAAGNDPTLVLC